MAFSESELDTKAIATGDLLIQAIFESQTIEQICQTYEQVTREMQTRFGEAPKLLGEDDLKRLFFEVLCFAAFIIMSQEVPKYLVFTRTSGDFEPDSESVRYFNGKLLDRLAHHLESQGFSRLREVVPTAVTPDIQFGLGEPLAIGRRIYSYFESDSSWKAAGLFSQYVAHAVDPLQSATLTMIGIRSVRPVVELTRFVLKAVFKDIAVSD